MQRVQARIGETAARLGHDDVMMPTPADEQRNRALKRIKRRRAFWMLLLSYLIVNAFLVAVWAFTGRGYFWPGWVMLGWLVGIAFSIISTYASGVSVGKPSENEIRREVDKDRDRDAA